MSSSSSFCVSGRGRSQNGYLETLTVLSPEEAGFFVLDADIRLFWELVPSTSAHQVAEQPLRSPNLTPAVDRQDNLCMAGLFETLGLGPKPVQENGVYYAVYPDQQPADEAELLALRTRCLQVIEPVLAGGYIWQLEPFKLTTSTHSTPPWELQKPGKAKTKTSAGSHVQKEQQQQPGCVWGCLRWGDNVEDEWMAVGLLCMCTTAIPNISVQVWDTDGEFLLIEAAYALPRWLRPDTATHRVWLRGGALHIIPQPGPKARSVPAFPTLAQAIQILASGQVRTLAPKPDALIQHRLHDFPHTALAAGRHRAKAVLPVRIAAVLLQEPQLVAAAVDAFFYRDADDMKAAARMSHFPPSEERVTVTVATNRCQYAQLAQQRFAPPKGWTLPPPSHPLAAAAERGLKLTAGFEILMARAERMRLATGAASHAAVAASPASGGASSSSHGSAQIDPVGGQSVAESAAPSLTQEPDIVVSEQQVSGHPLWPPYKASLQASGYFQGELEGSSKYHQLLSAAVQDFSQAVRQRQAAAAATDESDQGVVSGSTAEAPRRLVQLLEDTKHVTAEELENGLNWKEDDDSWMEKMAELLDQELGKRESESQQHQGRGSRTAHVDAAEVASAMHGFVEHARAGLEGAEVPGEDDPFNPSAFLRQLQQVLGIADLPDSQHQRTGGRHMRAAQGQHTGDLRGDEDENDEWETTDGEGSSFFTDSEEEYEEGEGQEDDEKGEGAFAEQLLAQMLDTTPAFRSTPAVGDGQGSAPCGSHGQAKDIAAPAGSEGHFKRRCSRPVANTQAAAAATADHQPGSKQVPEVVPWPNKPGLAALQERWEVFTATDSDDADSDMDETSSEGEDAASENSPQGQGVNGVGEQAQGKSMAEFMDMYSMVLQQQLAGTTLAETVDRAPTGLGRQPQQQRSSTAAAASGKQDAGEEGAAVKPLDLDFNLVQNLLRSVSSQQGLPGPASSLAGLLGVHLPAGNSDA